MKVNLPRTKCFSGNKGSNQVNFRRATGVSAPTVEGSKKPHGLSVQVECRAMYLACMVHSYFTAIY